MDIRNELQNKILVLDGSMNASLHKKNLNIKHFGDKKYAGCNEVLNITSPDIIVDIHKEYIYAGADIIETNTFDANSVSLGYYGLEKRDEEINKTAAKLAKMAVLETGREVFTCGTIGLRGKSIGIMEGLEFSELIEVYFRQARGLLQGEVDILLLKAVRDTRNARAAMMGIHKAFEQLQKELPLIISTAIDETGLLDSGETLDTFYITVQSSDMLALGINCCSSFKNVENHLLKLNRVCEESYMCCFLSGYMLSEDGTYSGDPESLSKGALELAEKGYVNILGGCFGSTPDHIRQLKKTVQGLKPKKIEHKDIYYDNDDKMLIISESKEQQLSSDKLEIFTPKSMDRIELTNISIGDLLPFINEQMLYSNYLGLKGNYKQLINTNNERAVQLSIKVSEVLEEAKEWITPKAVYQFFQAHKDGNDIAIYKNYEKELSFTFPRQKRKPQLCLSDYVRDVSDEMDYIGVFAVTVGSEYINYVNECKYRAEYLKSHIIQSVALTLAEALAEKVYGEMVNQGLRVSFGHSECPFYEEQIKLFRLIQPEKIGIKLIMGQVLSPEASVSGIVLTHPKAKYFTV